MMRMSRKKKEGCLFDKCEPYWLNGAEAYLHTEISSLLDMNDGDSRLLPFLLDTDVSF